MTPTTEPECSTGHIENGVCQPIGGMTPDDLAPLEPERGEPAPVDAPSPCAADQTEVAAGICVDTDAVFPTTTAPTVPPPLIELPATGASMIGAELAAAVTLTAIGARLMRWAR